MIVRALKILVAAGVVAVAGLGTSAPAMAEMYRRSFCPGEARCSEDGLVHAGHEDAIVALSLGMVHLMQQVGVVRCASEVECLAVYCMQ